MTSCALIVPIRDFATAKSRLNGILPDSTRRALAELCATRVLDRRAACQRIVVCDDDEVETWSAEVGASCVGVANTGLNAALDEALPRIVAMCPGAHLMIAHGDIIDPSGLDEMISAILDGSNDDSPEVVIVPDRHFDGTNVLVLDPRIVGAWTFEYGPGSFDKHVRQAEERGFRVRVHRDSGLAIDVDTPDDLVLADVRAFLDSNFPHIELFPKNETEPQ